MKRLKQLLAFNRGVISKTGLARIDIERMEMSAEQMTNWIPRVLGSMMLRPGLGFISRSNGDLPCRNVPFVFSADDTVLLEMTNGNVRFRIDDVLLQRVDVSTTITNGLFTSTLGTGWTDVSDVGGSAFINTGTQILTLSGDGTDYGRVQNTVTVAGPDQGVEHAIRLVVEEGYVWFKVGSTAGDDDYVAERALGKGIHSLSFEPTGNFVIQIAHERQFNAWVDSCTIETGLNPVQISTPWGTNDLPYLRWTQSGDVMYFACKNGDLTGVQWNAEHLIKIERSGDGRSWGVVNYLPEDGPFRIQNVSGITMAPSALNGDINITSSEPFFKLEHATFNSLIRIASNGQTVTKQISSADDWTTPPIRVTGSGTARVFQIIVEGTFSATVKLQFAFSADGPWNDQGQTWTAPVSTNYDDGQEGSIIYYRIGVDAGDYTSGTVTCTLVYANGSIEGIARIRNFTSSTQVQAQVLSPFGSLDATKDWWEGEWSAENGYPTSVAIHEGRLAWAGNDRIWLSQSDQYETFNDAVEGDAAAIDKQIGSGPIRVIHWLLSMGRLMIGTADNSANIAAAVMDGNHPLSARSSNFDEPLTPFNFNIKQSSPKAVFVDRTKQRLYEILFNVDTQDYSAIDLSIFAPDYNSAGIKQIAVQMKPDIRVHCVRDDGTVGMLVYDRLENVICWCEIESPGAGGLIEDVAILPGAVEDQVYYVVKRLIDGTSQRHIVKWALESEARGATVNKVADSFSVYSGAATTTPFTTELLHLEGESCVVWADGAYVGDFIVDASGGLTLTTAASDVIVGLGYMARFKSAKLGELDGITLLERKKVNRLGFIAKWMHHLGLKYGPDFTNLRELPQVENGKPTADGTVWEDYHEDNFAFGGDWDTDSRICLEANAPKPVTLLAAIAEMESVERKK